MSKKQKMAAAFSEVNDLLDEMKAVLKSHGYDFDECDVDEDECADTFGEDIFRLYQLHKEAKEIAEQ